MLAMFEHTIGGRAMAYEDAVETLRRIIDQAAQVGADQVLMTGDLTGYATPREFGMVSEAMGALRGDRELCAVVPGNHDYFTPGVVRNQAFEQMFATLLVSDMPEYCVQGPYPFVQFRGPDVAVIGLCSAVPPTVPGVALGRVGAVQLAMLRAMLSDARMDGRAVLVLVHHAPRTAEGKRDSRTHGLVDADALLELLPGPRFAVLHGHLHQRFYTPATASRPHLFCAGSSTQRGHEGYCLVETKNGRVSGGAIHALSGGAIR